MREHREDEEPRLLVLTVLGMRRRCTARTTAMLHAGRSCGCSRDPLRVMGAYRAPPASDSTDAEPTLRGSRADLGRSRVQHRHIIARRCAARQRRVVFLLTGHGHLISVRSPVGARSPILRILACSDTPLSGTA